MFDSSSVNSGHTCSTGSGSISKECCSEATAPFCRDPLVAETPRRRDRAHGHRRRSWGPAVAGRAHTLLCALLPGSSSSSLLCAVGNPGEFRITQWVGLEGPLKDPLVPNPLPWAGTRSASPGCTKTHCSNPHGHFHCPHSKKFLLNI